MVTKHATDLVHVLQITPRRQVWDKTPRWKMRPVSIGPFVTMDELNACYNTIPQEERDDYHSVRTRMAMRGSEVVKACISPKVLTDTARVLRGDFDWPLGFPRPKSKRRRR